MDYWLEFTPSYTICKLFSGGRKTGDRRAWITPTKHCWESFCVDRLGFFKKRSK